MKATGNHYTPSLEGILLSITHITIAANKFKSFMIQMIENCYQFSGHAHKDPSAYISKFLQLCDIVKINGVSKEAIRLKMFAFSLNNKAWRWLQYYLANHFTNWNDPSKKFLSKYLLILRRPI